MSTNVTIPNPFTALSNFIGSANVQKTLASLQVGIGGLTSAEGKTLGTHITAMSVGAVYGLAVHWFDYLRAKIGK